MRARLSLFRLVLVTATLIAVSMPNSAKAQEFSRWGSDYSSTSPLGYGPGFTHPTYGLSGTYFSGSSLVAPYRPNSYSGFPYSAAALTDSSYAPDGLYLTRGVIPLADNKAHFAVRVPDPNAELFIDGQKTTSLGTVRYLNSPPLSPGAYRYEMTAKWRSANGKTTTETKRVEFGRNSRVNVDFTKQ